MKDEKIENVIFKCDKGFKELIKEYAKYSRQSMSRFIREALLKEMSRIEKEKNEKGE